MVCTSIHMGKWKGLRGCISSREIRVQWNVFRPVVFNNITKSQSLSQKPLSGRPWHVNKEIPDYWEMAGRFVFTAITAQVLSAQGFRRRWVAVGSALGEALTLKRTFKSRNIWNSHKNGMILVKTRQSGSLWRIINKNLWFTFEITK